MAKSRINWEEMRRDYIYASPKKSYSMLADEYGMAVVTVSIRGAKENWVEAREKVQSRLTSKRFEDALTEEILGELDLIESAQMSAKILIDTILKISVRVLDSAFSDDISSINADKLLNTLSTLSNSLERILKTLSLLQGGPSETIQYNLIDVLSNPITPS